MKNHYVGQFSMRKYWMPFSNNIKKFFNLFSIKKIDENETLKALIRKMGFLAYNSRSKEYIAASELFVQVTVIVVCLCCMATSACCVLGRN